MEKTKINVLINENVNNTSYINLLSKVYQVNVIPASEYTYEKLDLILFVGGEDVDPRTYGELPGKYTSVNLKRDDYEKRYLFYKDHCRNVPKLGICRGSQLLTVLSGGKLIQHVNNHGIGGTHPIVFRGAFKGMSAEITSTHHQMMYPYDLNENDYEIIATTDKYLSTTYLNGNNTETVLHKKFEECEIVYYPDTLSLCIQGHPESSNCPESTQNIILSLIANKLNL